MSASAAASSASSAADGGKLHYVSTRGAFADAPLKFSDAVLMGLATDGGLLVPTRIPKLGEATLRGWLDGAKAGKPPSYCDIALEVMWPYVADDGSLSRAELKDVIERSYATFRSPEVTPVRSPSAGEGGGVYRGDGSSTLDLHLLELWHGPTWAFKDVALQCLGNLFDVILKKRQGTEGLTIVGATSGDTGSSAICGVRGKDAIDCIILFPRGRVSPIQELQMTTIAAQEKNVHCVAVEGTFDDCQAMVKELFTDAPFKGGLRLWRSAGTGRSLSGSSLRYSGLLWSALVCSGLLWSGLLWSGLLCSDPLGKSATGERGARRGDLGTHSFPSPSLPPSLLPFLLLSLLLSLSLLAPKPYTSLVL